MKSTDNLKELMVCMSPDIYLHAQEYMDRLATECCTCTDKAMMLITYKTTTGKLVTAQFCDECYYENALWEGREIIKVTKL